MKPIEPGKLVEVPYLLLLILVSFVFSVLFLVSTVMLQILELFSSRVFEPISRSAAKLAVQVEGARNAHQAPAR